jgi:hypothetical protein
VEKASKFYVRNELIPLQKRIKEINLYFNEEIINFEKYEMR